MRHRNLPGRKLFIILKDCNDDQDQTKSCKMHSPSSFFTYPFTFVSLSISSPIIFLINNSISRFDDFKSFIQSIISIRFSLPLELSFYLFQFLLLSKVVRFIIQQILFRGGEKEKKKISRHLVKFQFQV